MIEPMLCTLAKEDITILTLSEWIEEPKLDGMRLIALKKGESVKLCSRRHQNVTSKFPEVVAELKLIPGDWTFDGELTAEGGFLRLLKRNTSDNLKIRILSKMIPATYNIFDILEENDIEFTSWSLLERKVKLSNIVKDMAHVKLVPWKHPTNIKEDFQAYISEGYEGSVLKRALSKYQPGIRGYDWLKIKEKDTIDVEVIGATKSEASIAFGALILVRNGKYIGKVGSGFSDDLRTEIYAALKENTGDSGIMLPPEVKSELLISTKPMKAEIKVQEILGNGSLRSPVWHRFRWD